MGYSGKSKFGRAKRARPSKSLPSREMLSNTSIPGKVEVLTIPPEVLDVIESQRGVLVSVISLLHCLHIVLEHRQDHIDEEPKPRIEVAARWASLPEITALLMERTHSVLAALDSDNITSALMAVKP